MNIMSLLNALPGAVAQGLIWGIMAIGVYITFRILDFADLTVDGSFVYRRCSLHYDDAKADRMYGCPCLQHFLQVWWQVCVTGLLHTFMGIPAILSGILTQLGLYSINLKIMGKANQAINVDKYRPACFFTFYPQCASL